jgi:hypothetical protein
MSTLEIDRAVESTSEAEPGPGGVPSACWPTFRPAAPPRPPPSWKPAGERPSWSADRSDEPAPLTSPNDIELGRRRRPLPPPVARCSERAAVVVIRGEHGRRDELLAPCSYSSKLGGPPASDWSTAETRGPAGVPGASWRWSSSESGPSENEAESESRPDRKGWALLPAGPVWRGGGRLKAGSGGKRTAWGDVSAGGGVKAMTCRGPRRAGAGPRRCWRCCSSACW